MNENFKSHQIVAFTLAEVLITLGIIGVVAALTIPNLIKDYQEKVLISQFKKTYSLLNQVHKQVLNDNGDPRSWNVTCLNDLANLYAPYFQTLKVIAPANSDYGDATQMGYKNPIMDLRKLNQSWIHPQIKLTDGTLIVFGAPWQVPTGLNCSTPSTFCFIIVADVNGSKPPNRAGVDVFNFMPTPAYISPQGASNLSWGANKCQTNGTPSSNGASCGAWVLQHENMDYLKCIDKGQASFCNSY